MKSVASSTRCTSVPTCGPAGMPSSGTGSPSGGAAAARHRRGRLVLDDVLLRLARHARLVHAGRDPAVGGAPPARVERAVERGGLQLEGRRPRRRPRDGQPEPRALDRDAARRRRGQRLEAGDGGGVGRGRAQLVGDVALLVAGEQQARERRVAAVPRAGPPDHRPVAGAGQRDVGQAQVLAALLDGLLLAVALVVPALQRDVEPALVARVRVVEGDGMRARGLEARLPQEGHVDDAELEPLGAVDRQHLDGVGVGLEAAAALLVVDVTLGLGDAPAQPSRQRGGAELLGRDLGVQELGDVAQVGQPALAVGGREDALGQAAERVTVSGQRRHAARAQDGGPVVQLPVHVLPVVLGCRGHTLGRPAEEAGQRGGMRAQARGGPLDGLQQPEPLARRLGAEHAARAVDDGRDAARPPAPSRTRRALWLVRTSTATSPGSTSPRVEHADEVGGEVLGHVLARRRAARRSPTA